jgi:cephalosporin-C deacetylase-like acetyl esterase
MPKIHRSGQEWILDRFVTSMGIDALMPEFMTFMGSPVYGFNNSDIDRIKKRTKGLSGMRRMYEKVAARREAIALEAEKNGYYVTARRHYHQASLAYGFAQYTIQEDGDPLKAKLHSKCQKCYAKVIQYASTPIEKVEIPFSDEPAYNGNSFPGVLHLPEGDGPFPCVIFIEGTDMHKEMIPNPEDNIFTKRGMACLSIDGPGQGESLLRMLKVHVETQNYERAVGAAIDYLSTRPEIDSKKIGVFGVSTGSYWAATAALWEARHENRIKACVGLMAQWEPSFVKEMEYQQINFKTNYMYMAGLDDENEFDRLAPLHNLKSVISEIRCPILMCQGEFDELCSPEQVEEILQDTTVPYTLRIYEEEFHPLAGVAMEAWEGALDWTLDRFEGKPVEQKSIRVYPSVWEEWH